MHQVWCQDKICEKFKILNATGINQLREWNDGREFLREHYPKFNPQQIICGQTFLWNPKCHYHGCDLRPDQHYYDKPKGQIMEFADMDEFQKQKNLDPRTSPYQPICFRCGTRWGASEGL